MQLDKAELNGALKVLSNENRELLIKTKAVYRYERENQQYLED